MRDHLAAAVAAVVMMGAFVVELVASRLLHRDRHYDWRDTFQNLYIGGVYSVTSTLQGLLVAGVFVAAWRYAPLRWDMRSGWSWLVLILVEDFFYYWSHRGSHQVRFMWASHAVHHNSPCLNLSTGMRNSWVGGYLDWVFYLPSVALGFDPVSLAAVKGFATAWDFVAHTPYIGKNRVLDLLFNSPSNHRVHHGCNPEYVDKNFGGFLIIWDRLFGTYQREVAPVICGLERMPERPRSAVYVEFYLWAELLGLRRAPDKCSTVSNSSATQE
jgi:sterol desaturase/sphingolipid hydroxylase (fatty acid hydroxylase superfamily)